MKLYLLLSLMFLLSCSKEVTKPAGQNSLTDGSQSSGAKTKTVSDLKEDSIDNANSGSDFGYVRYGIMQVPDEIKYSGSIVAMAQWKDKSGSNILLITETNETSNEDSRSKELFGYHYIADDEGGILLWKINDFVKDCPVDLTLNYIDKSLIITDLDKNGTAESSFLYRMSCKGDVSADDMKLMMHEGKNKYAIRGVMNLVMNGQDLEAGRINADESFDKAPVGFLEFAESQWKKYNVENIGN